MRRASVLEGALSDREAGYEGAKIPMTATPISKNRPLESNPKRPARNLPMLIEAAPAAPRSATGRRKAPCSLAAHSRAEGTQATSGSIQGGGEGRISPDPPCAQKGGTSTPESQPAGAAMLARLTSRHCPNNRGRLLKAPRPPVPFSPVRWPTSEPGRR